MLNSSAKIVFIPGRYTGTTPVPKKLQWLAVGHRYVFLHTDFSKYFASFSILIVVLTVAGTESPE